MNKVSVQCVGCGRKAVVAHDQPCFYCGRTYTEAEIDRLLKEGKAEVIEFDKLLSEHGVVFEPSSPRGDGARWRRLLLTVVALFFFFFCVLSVLLAYRLLK